jgi:glutaredoxin
MNIIVYTKQNCQACEKFKPIIRKICDCQHLKLEFNDITENEEMQHRLNYIGVKAFPATFIYNKNNNLRIEIGCFSENYIMKVVENEM